MPEELQKNVLSTAREDALVFAIEEADYWVRLLGEEAKGQHQYGMVIGRIPKSKNKCADIFTEDELCTIDPRMAVVLPYLGDTYATAIGDMLITGTDFYHTALLYSTTLYTIPAHAWVLDPEDADAVAQDVGAIFNFLGMEPEPEQGYVRIVFERLVLEKTNCGVDFARHAITVSNTVSTSWFDASYPGWQERYDIAKGLDLSDAEVMAFVQFPPDCAAPEPMAGIAFNNTASQGAPVTLYSES